MRRHIYLLCGVLLALVISSVIMGLLLTPPPVPDVATPFTTVGTPAFTERPRYADLILLLDQSGSMSLGKYPTDPGNLRVNGSLAGIDFLASHADAAHRIRFGLVHFGSVAAKEHLPLTDVARLQRTEAASARAVIRALRLGDTNILDALRRGAQLLAQPPTPDAARVLVLFTDGDPVDARRLTTAQYFEELQTFVKTELATQGIELYLIGIDAHGDRLSATLPRWREFVPKENIFHVDSMPEMKLAFNTIAQRLWRLPAGDEETMTAKTGTETFAVPPYQERLELFVFSQGTPYRLTVRRPNGTSVQPGFESRVPAVKRQLACDQITVMDPEPGTWSLHVQENTKPVRVVRNLAPFRMKLVSPAKEQPAGKPVTLVAAYTKADGSVVPIDPEHPVKATADVTMPGEKKPRTVEFPPEQVKDGMLYSEPLPVTEKAAGEMAVNLKTAVDGKTASEQPLSVPVTPTPYLQASDDAVRQSAKEQGIDISSQLMQNGKPLPSAQAKTLMKEHQAVAQLYDPVTKKVVAETVMRHRNGKLHGQLPLPEKGLENGVLLMSLVKKQKRAAHPVPPAVSDTTVQPLKPAVLASARAEARGTSSPAPRRPRHYAASWGTLAIIIFGSLAAIVLFVVVVLNYQRFVSRFILHQGPVVYYWAEHHNAFQLLELGEQRKCTIESLGLHITCDEKSLYHVRADSAGVLYDADDKPADELTYRDRLALIVCMGRLAKIRLHLAASEGRITRPAKYGVKSGK